MSSASEIRKEMVLAALDLLPPTLRETLVQDVRLRDGYGIQVDSVFGVDDSDLEAQVSEIASGIGSALAGTPGATVSDTEGNEWSIDARTDGDQPTLVLDRGEQEVGMHGWLTLSPDRDTRLRCLEALATDAGLPAKASSSWQRVLEERRLAGEEVLEFLKDLHDTARVQEQFLADSVRTSGLASRLAAPRSGRYFERLVGVRGDSASIQAHAAAGGRKRLAELAAWRPYEGFLQSLYMASHPDLSDQIQVDGLSSKELVQAFERILRVGDRLSQLGAIEVGCRVSAARPEVTPTLSELVRRICADEATERGSRFRAYSFLYVLVSNELSTRQQLAGEPSFFRRLAALAQAGVIQRQTTVAGIRPSDSALESVTGEHLLQSFVDLRLEPRRHPSLAYAERMRKHFLGRIVRAADRYENELDADLIQDLRHVMGPEQLREAGGAFVLYAPGPLEEREEDRPLPAEFAQAIQAQLRTDEVVRPVDFWALRTSATSFRIGNEKADLAANALKRSDYRLADVGSRAELLDALASLAAVAAIARSRPLADALRAVVRRYVGDAQFPLALLEATQILLVAAASREKLADWADFVGDCLTECAFGDLTVEEGRILQGQVRRLCELEPELWSRCGSADAALMAFNASGVGAHLQEQSRADELLKRQESKTLEFKSSLRWNLKDKRRDTKHITHAVLKTIAAFLNTEGGDLLIGVADDRRVLGIDHDDLGSDDKFVRHLTQVVRNGLGNPAGVLIDPMTEIVDGKTICVVTCQRSREPVYLRWKGLQKAAEGDFFVRSGAETVRFAGSDAKRYVAQHFAAPEATPE